MVHVQNLRVPAYEQSTKPNTEFLWIVKEVGLCSLVEVEVMFSRGTI